VLVFDPSDPPTMPIVEVDPRVWCQGDGLNLAKIQGLVGVGLARRRPEVPHLRRSGLDRHEPPNAKFGLDEAPNVFGAHQHAFDPLKLVFKLAADPLFVEKVYDIIGLHLNPARNRDRLLRR
jgi:hypothetical protein